MSPDDPFDRDNVTPTAVGARLARLRAAYGLSRTEMCAQINLDVTSWGRFEDAKRELPRRVALQLVRRFDVTLDFLILGRTAGLPHEMVERLRHAELQK